MDFVVDIRTGPCKLAALQSSEVYTMPENSMIFEGAPIPSQEVARSAAFQSDGQGVLAIGLHDVPGEVVVFNDPDAFLQWLPRSDDAQRVREIFAKAAELRSRRTGAPDADTVLKKDEEAQHTLTELGREMNLPAFSAEVLRSAHERGLIHSLLVYDGPDGQGSSMYFDGPVVSLGGRLGWDNRISSYRPFGFGGMWDRDWFQGPSVALGGFGQVISFPNSSLGWFDKRASSLYVSGP